MVFVGPISWKMECIFLIKLTKSLCQGYIICKIYDYFGVMEMYISGES